MISWFVEKYVSEISEMHFKFVDKKKSTSWRAFTNAFGTSFFIKDKRLALLFMSSSPIWFLLCTFSTDLKDASNWIKGGCGYRILLPLTSQWRNIILKLIHIPLRGIKNEVSLIINVKELCHRFRQIWTDENGYQIE